MALPKLDREAYREQMRAEVERTLQEVADAVDNAPQGRVIRDSEEKSRDALDRFRRTAYEKAVQMKVNAAEAASPPLRPTRRPGKGNGTKENSPRASSPSMGGLTCGAFVGTAGKRAARSWRTVGWTKQKRRSAKGCGRWPVG